MAKGYTYGGSFSALEKKRINDIIYRMRKEGYNVTAETRKHITSAKNVREQVAKHVTFQAIAKSGRRVGVEYSGEEALKLHRLAVQHNKEIVKMQRKAKYKGVDLSHLKANTSLSGIGPSSAGSRKRVFESEEAYQKRLRLEGERSRRAAEEAWTRSVEEALDRKREIATENIMNILGDGYELSIHIPTELEEAIKEKLNAMTLKEFNEFMENMQTGDFNIFEFYKAGYEDLKEGMRDFLEHLGFDVEEGYSISGKAYDEKDNVVYLNTLIDGEEEEYPFY